MLDSYPWILYNKQIYILMLNILIAKYSLIDLIKTSLEQSL